MSNSRSNSLPKTFSGLSGLHSMTINHGALKTCADKLLLSRWHLQHTYYVKLKSNFSVISSRSRNPVTCKIEFFVTIVNTSNEYTISQF